MTVLQVAEYRSNKEEACKARVAQEQADLDAMHKKEAEEEVHYLSSCCMAPCMCVTPACRCECRLNIQAQCSVHPTVVVSILQVFQSMRFFCIKAS